MFASLQPRNRSLLALLWLSAVSLLFACQPVPQAAQPTRYTVTISADGDTQTLTTEAATVRQAVEEAGVALDSADELDPPGFTPLSDNLAITITRITESRETILQPVPFTRKVVRNDALPADAEPVIIQAGKDGLQETTVRIVFRDGLEAERWETDVQVVEPAQDEIVMIGSAAPEGEVTFAGTLAFIGESGAQVMQGTSAEILPINTGGDLDGRVFALSPAGDFLLFTRSETDDNSFGNSLWVVAISEEASDPPDPIELDVENVLWAGWDPSDPDALRFAYTTAEPTNLPPGWEANNDLWIAIAPTEDSAEVEQFQLIESYPATYGWWGGNYAWSPSGSQIAVSFANEISLLDTTSATPDDDRRILAEFTEYNTLSDWVWVPPLSWSPDGRFLATTLHSGTPSDASAFDTQVVDVETEAGFELVTQSGMWSHPHWSPGGVRTLPDSTIAYLQANDPLNGLTSRYTLWLMDSDGSNRRQAYPPPGEISGFSNDANSLTWGPSGRDLAFVFDDQLMLYNLDREIAIPISAEGNDSHPTWAPYGAARDNFEPATQFTAEE